MHGAAAGNGEDMAQPMRDEAGGDVIGNTHLRKRFFFEKKKQKTFVSLDHRCSLIPALQEQKFFAELFFKKATTYLN